MDAAGASNPDVYILTDFVSESDDDAAELFSGKEGKFLHPLLSKYSKKELRVGSIVRCHSKTVPELPAIESCRPSVERDIAQSKPKLVIGLGNVPLHWVSGISQISLYRGRVFPVNIGGHECWFFSINHPSYVLRSDKRNDVNPHRIIFDIDLKLAFSLVRTLPKAHVWGPEEGATIEIFDGSSSSQVTACIRAIERLSPTASATDIETTALHPYSKKSKILTASISSVDDCIAFPLEHPGAKWTERDRLRVWGAYYDYLMHGTPRVAHNTKFEQKWLSAKCGPSVLFADWHDTMASAHTLDERPGALSLDAVTFLNFGFGLKAVSDINPVLWQGVHIAKFLKYNALDSLWCIRDHVMNMSRLEADPKLLPEYQRALRVGRTLVRTEDRGVQPDLDKAGMLEFDLSSQIADITADIMRTPEVRRHLKSNPSFSPTSPENVGQLYGTTFNRPEVRDHTGKISADEEKLALLPANLFPSAPLILSLRSLSKLLSTYIKPIVTRAIVQEDGLIHTSYNHLLVVTGRLSSNDPNLQNFPKRKYKYIRSIIQAPQRDGIPHFLVSADYGQIEARVIAMASEDKALVSHLWSGFDIHGYWADFLIKAFPKIQDRMATEYEIPRDDVKALRKAVRNDIKNGWVFPQFYGSVVESCAANMKIPVEVARKMGDEFWGEFTGVKSWQKRTIATWEKKGYVETLTGRRRRGPMSVNEIINTCSQGTASDLVVDAMSRLSETWQFDMTGMMDDRFQALMNIHDDLTFGLPEDSLEDDISIIAKAMCLVSKSFDFINVPITVEVSCGTDWSNQEEIGVFSSEDFK
jgi:uracil-DNA glycosylase family 4